MFQRGGFHPVKPGYLLFRTLNYCLKNPHKTYIGDVRCDAGRVFDDTSYFVTVGLSNTVQLRLLGKVVSDVGTPRVSFVLPNSALLLLLLSCSPSSFLLMFFSQGNKDVFTLFDLRVSSLTEPGLYQDCRWMKTQAQPAMRYSKFVHYVQS